GGDLNFSRTFPGVIQATLNSERFRIRSDGKAIRDFLYVKDAARAYSVVAEGLAQRPELGGQAFNLSMAQKLPGVGCVGRGLGPMQREDLEPIIENSSRAEIQEQYMTCDKARETFGWAPDYGMDEALKETIEWYGDYFGLPTKINVERRAAAHASA